jgi:hypothetical protein
MVLKASRRAGLPDGLFSNQKSKICFILEGLGVNNFDTFYGHLVHLLCFNIFYYGHLVHLLCFNIFYYGHLVYWKVFDIFFPRFGMLYEEKSGIPGDEWKDPPCSLKTSLRRPSLHRRMLSVLTQTTRCRRISL